MNTHDPVDQAARKLLYLGPDPDDDDSVVVTVELTCRCVITRVLSERRISHSTEVGYGIKGDLPCPKGHPSPAWLHERPTWLGV